jgi:hypothetical protein
MVAMKPCTKISSTASIGVSCQHTHERNQDGQEKLGLRQSPLLHVQSIPYQHTQLPANTHQHAPKSSPFTFDMAVNMHHEARMALTTTKVATQI